MKNSERNRLVLENFLLHLTHCSEDESERDFDVNMTFTPRQLYNILDDYIKEDHVDGEGNPEDFKSEEQRAKELLSSKGYYTDLLWQVDDVKGKFECTDEEAQDVLNNAFSNEATFDQILMSIECAGEMFNLKPIEDD